MQDYKKGDKDERQRGVLLRVAAAAAVSCVEYLRQNKSLNPPIPATRALRRHGEFTLVSSDRSVQLRKHGARRSSHRIDEEERTKRTKRTERAENTERVEKKERGGK